METFELRCSFDEEGKKNRDGKGQKISRDDRWRGSKMTKGVGSGGNRV